MTPHWCAGAWLEAEAPSQHCPQSAADIGASSGEAVH